MAKINRSLESGLVDLVIDTAKNTVTIVNQNTRDALFNVMDPVLKNPDLSSVVVWSHIQPSGTQSTIEIPTVGSNGPITWQVGNITNPKTGQTELGITSPPWQLTMA
jgi:hypothetical protein